jgi:hypothetical protein
MTTMANTAFSGEAFQGNLEEFIHESRSSAERLRNEWQAADGARIFWDTLASYVAKGWVCHIHDHLDKEKERLRQWRTAGHPAITTLENLYREAKSAADQGMIAFPGDLERACTESNLQIDRTSREPHYTFQNGFLELDVDTGKHLAHLKDREARLATVPADIGAVIEVVTEEYQRLFGRQFEGEKFLRKLRSNYQAVLKKENLPDGETLPIRRITHRLGKNEKGFHTDEFLIDLSRLAEEGPLELDGMRLDLQQTKDTNQGMLLHGVASRGYIGFIVFRKA